MLFFGNSAAPHGLRAHATRNAGTQIRPSNSQSTSRDRGEIRDSQERRRRRGRQGRGRAWVLLPAQEDSQNHRDDNHNEKDKAAATAPHLPFALLRLLSILAGVSVFLVFLFTSANGEILHPALHLLLLLFLWLFGRHSGIGESPLWILWRGFIHVPASRRRSLSVCCDWRRREVNGSM